MNHSARLAAPLLCAALLLSAEVTGESANAQGQSAASRPSKTEILKQQGRYNNTQAAPDTPRNYPQMSNEFLTGLEMLGVRPGQTLREARAQAAAWGARLEKQDQSNLDKLAKPSPANPYNPPHIISAFTYRAVPDADYRGHPDTFNPDTPVQRGRVGMTTVMVFPLDPLGDLDDPDNLMVYLVTSNVFGAGSRAGVMSEAEFLKQGSQRAGQKLHTAMSGNRADCGFLIPDYAQRITGLAGVETPQTPAHLPAWRTCGPVAMVVVRKTGERVFGYGISYSGAALAERAFQAFRAYGADYRRTPVINAPG